MGMAELDGRFRMILIGIGVKALAGRFPAKALTPETTRNNPKLANWSGCVIIFC